MEKEKKGLIISFLLLCNIIAFSAFLDLRVDRNFKIIFFDVGQGDAALIRTPDRKNILIDGGPGDKILAHLSEKLPFWDRNIDLMILTHAHADHLSGLVEVLERFNVKKVLWNKQSHDSLLYRQWELLLEDIDSRRAYKGQRIDLNGAYLDILYPSKDIDFSEDLNENSVIKRFVHDKGEILFTGDAYKKQERKLLEWEKKCIDQNFDWCRVMDIPSQVLKVGHHGSSTSSDYEFVERVNPEVSIISAGKNNRYGHPHEKVLETFNSLDIEMHKTFEDGNFKVKVE